MPSVVEVPIVPESISAVTPARLHGLVSTWIERDLSVQQHRSPRKGFSVATQHVPGQPLTIRVGLVDDNLLERLADGVLSETGRGRLHGGLVPDAPPVLMASVDWGELIRAAAEREDPPRSFSFVAHTGIAFRHGRLTNPLPIPGNVFGHLRARWAEFAPPDLAPDLELRDLGLVISRLDGGTELTVVRGKRVPGFVGRFTVHAAEADERALRVLDALARLAPFAGIGANTTIGMGRCDYLPR